MTRPSTIALCGLGAAAHRIHLPACAKVDGLTVVAGCDPARPARTPPFPVFDDLDELLAATTPDVVAIVTPPEHHFDLARRALEAGCHVFCEKPFVPTLEEADALVELCASTGRTLVVNNEYRCMAMHAAAKDRIGGPGFGELLFVSAHQTFYVTDETERGWRGRERRRTCLEFGTHVLDLCRFFFGTEPERLRARMPRPGRPDGPDMLDLIELDFPGDRVAHVTLDRLSRGRHRYLEMRLDGSEGCIETSLGGKLALNVGIEPRARRPFAELDVAMGGRARLYRGEAYTTLARDPLDLYPSATAALLRAMLDAIERGERPPCDAADNRRTLALMLAAYDAADEDRPIPLRDGLPAG